MSWLEDDDPGFGVAHLPYGVFATPGAPPRAGVRINGHVLDLAPVPGDPVFAAPALNWTPDRMPAHMTSNGAEPV